MHGNVTRYIDTVGLGYILGEDGVKYLFNTDCFVPPFNLKQIRFGMLVEFEPADRNRAHLVATNIKLKYVDHHPFCSDLEQVIKYIQDNVRDSDERKYRIRQLKAIDLYLATDVKCTNNAVKLKYMSKV